MTQTVTSPAEPDAFTDSVLRRIDPEVRSTFTDEQQSALVEAISASRPLSKHPVDLRGVVPLVFSHYYFVLLMGPDRRRGTKKLENERRQRTAFAGGILFFLFIISPFLLLGLFLLYTMKSDWGINLMKDKHAYELFGL